VKSRFVVVFTSVFTIFAGKKKAVAINLVSNDNFPTCWVRAIELGRRLPQKIFLLLVAFKHFITIINIH
jgi:hypothetical protein